MPEIRFKKLNPEAVIPKYQTAGAAGFDFHLLEDISIPMGATLAVGTGLAASIPEGFALLLLPRSSTGIKFHLKLANTAGVIDSDYRGEIICVLKNEYPATQTFTKGTRLVQGILVPVPQHTILEVDDLDSTERGAGGFGSTSLPERQKPNLEFFLCGKNLKWAKPTLQAMGECLLLGKGLADVLLRFTNDVGEITDEIVEESLARRHLLDSADGLLYVKYNGYWKQVSGIRPASVPF